MSCFSIFVSFFISCGLLFSTPRENLDPPHFHWTQTIRGDQISLELVTDEREASFHAICEMYQIDATDLAKELNDMVLWCVYDGNGEPIGALQLNSYHSLEDLQSQVFDSHLASTLFHSGKFLELSYALTEKNRGHGLGSTVVKTWVDHARKNGWSPYLFAVVSDDNIPSLHILAKCEFHYVGHYIYEEFNKKIHVYTDRDSSIGIFN